MPATRTQTHRYNNPLDETTIYDPYALVKKAKGSYIWMEGQTQPYIDLLMSYSSTNFGHTNPDIVHAVKKAASKTDNVIGFNSDYKVKLSHELVRLLPHAGHKIVYFPVGGTKAVDAAIKLAKAHTKKDTIIAFRGAFHGYSYAAMSVTDSGYIEKSQYGSLPGPVKMFPFPHRFAPNADHTAKQILSEIEKYLRSHHKHVAAIIFEPIQGAAGFIIPPKNFVRDLVALAKRYKVVSICDEIQTGVGRTGTFYYINQLNIDPDIVLLSKSLAGGYYPLSAVIADKTIFNSVDIKHPGFDSTFATNIFGIEIAYFVLDYIKKQNILSIVKTSGKYFYNELKKVTDKYSFIKDLDYSGMAYGYRIEAPSKHNEDNARLAKSIKREAYKQHLIIQTAGVHANHMKLAPNFLISKKEISEVMKRLDRVFLACTPSK